jgi:hypothetical protein
MPLTKEEIENNKRLINDKLFRIEQKEIEERHGNNFSILEPNIYDNDEELFKKETKEQQSGFHIIDLLDPIHFI